MKFKYLLLFLFIIPLFSCYSQSENLKESLIFYDNLTGLENALLSKGSRHFNKYKISIGNHNFYRSPEYSKGELIYNNQPFFDIDIKYDLVKDLVIYKIPVKENFINIELIKNQLSRFSLNGSIFINSKVLDISENLQLGFVELVEKNNHFTFLIKHKKFVKEKINNNIITPVFHKKELYYIFYNEKLYFLKNHNSLKNIFPNLNKQINNYYKKNKPLLKSDKKAFFINLFKLINKNLN